MSLMFQQDAKTAEAKSHCPYYGDLSEGETTDNAH